MNVPRLLPTLLTLPALMWLGGTVNADTVYMNNGMRIEGKVHLETPVFIILLVYNDTGRIRIPRAQIKSIEYDFESKAMALDEDDYKGQYDLGVWAYSKGLYSEAIAQFEMVMGKDGAGEELLKLLGQAYDKKGQIDKAYEHFKDYLCFHEGDVEVKTRAEEIKKELGIGVAEATPATAEELKIKEGLEALFTWKDEKFGDYNSCVVRPTADTDTQNKMVVIQTKEGQKDKSVFSGVGANMLDLSQSKEIIFKAFHNGKRRINVAVAFTNRQGAYYESRQVSVAPNTWATLKIPIEGKVFKSQNSEWKFTDELSGKGEISRMFFLIYGADELTIYVDHVFFR